MVSSPTQPDLEPARLEVQNITAAYNGKPVLQNISFEVPNGARVAVVGPNGAGKSTLFKVLVGLLPVKQGHVLIHGRPLGHHQDCVAYVPQREEVDWRFPVSVYDVVMMGRFGKLQHFQRPGQNDQTTVERSLREMGISHLANHSISDLSGGQQQRVFLARALAQEPHIFLFDEPFNGVDAATQEASLSLLDHLRDSHVTVLVSTHDLVMAAERFDLVLLINRRIIAYGPAQQVFSRANLETAFGGQILNLEGALVIDQCCPPGEHEEQGKP